MPRYRYSTPHGGSRSERSLSTNRVRCGISRIWLPASVLRATGSHVPHRSLSQAHATSMPGTTWPVSRSPPGSSQDHPPTLVSMPSNLFRHLNGGSLAFVFLAHT